MNIRCHSNSTTMARATKTSLAMKLNAWFSFNFFVFISFNSLKNDKYRSTFLWSLGDHIQVLTQRRNWICRCVYVLQTTLQKEICCHVNTGCEEKHAGRAKFVVFDLLIRLIGIAVTVAFVIAPRIYQCA